MELFLEVDGLITECDGILLLHECIKNFPHPSFSDPQECSLEIIKKLSHQVYSFSIHIIQSNQIVSRRRKDFGGARILAAREEARKGAQGGKRRAEALDRGSAAA